jgi:uncharacterized membrane protein
VTTVSGEEEPMERIEKSVDVDQPVKVVYHQWTQFEEFPRFMEGVEEVKQRDDRHLHFVAKIAGEREEWDSEIVHQVPDQQIAWRSTGGAVRMGVVTFTPLDGDTPSEAGARTRVGLALEYEPRSFTEKVGDALGFMSRRVEGDLERFKQLVEERGGETGARRGEIYPPSQPGV